MEFETKTGRFTRETVQVVFLCLHRLVKTRSQWAKDHFLATSDIFLLAFLHVLLVAGNNQIEIFELHHGDCFQ